MLSCVLLAAGCRGGPEESRGAERAASVPSEPGRPIPPELRYERRTIPDSGNALPLLLEASDAVSLDFGDDVLLEALGAVAEEDASYPAGDAAKALDAHIAANERALELVDAAVARGVLEFPERWVRTNWDHFTKLVRVARIIDTRMARAKRSAGRGDLEEAARDIVLLVKFGDMLLESKVYLLAVIVGDFCSRRGREGARWLAGLEDAPPGLASRLLEAIPRVRERELVAGLLAMEWSEYVLPFIQAVPRDADLEVLAGHLSGAESPLDPHRRTFVKGFIELLRGHPRPFDSTSTVTEGERLFIELQMYFRGPWNVPDFDAGDIQEVQALWPEELLPDAASPESTCWNPLAPPDPEKLATAREALLRIENPAGKLLIGGILEFLHRAEHFRGEADREATRAILALCVHHDRKDAYPETLAELVTEGILPSVPIDPFTEGPLGWSRDALAVRTVGPDGKGLDEEGNELVWRVPATPPRRRP